MLTAIYLIIIILLLVIVHELGHFWAARKTKVMVEEFGFGLPPRACSIKSKKTNTIYSLNWLPIGGFVRLKGELGGEVRNGPTENSADPDSFSSKNIWQRAIIISGGILMNFVLAIVLFSIGYIIGLPQEINSDNMASSKLESKFAKIEDAKIHISAVLPNTPATKAQLQAKDIIIDIDGEKFSTINNLRNYLSSRKGKEVLVQIKRGDAKIFKQIAPQQIPESSVVGLGVGLYHTGTVSYPIYITPVAGFLRTYDISKEMIIALYDLVKNLITGAKVNTADIAGPVGIVSLISDISKLGFVYILQFTALLSINLAIINFIPFPALDGGRFLFLAIEGVRGKKVNEKTEAMFHNVGFALLMILILVVTYNDIVRLMSN